MAQRGAYRKGLLYKGKRGSALAGAHVQHRRVVQQLGRQRGRRDVCILRSRRCLLLRVSLGKNPTCPIIP